MGEDNRMDKEDPTWKGYKGNIYDNLHERTGPLELTILISSDKTQAVALIILIKSKLPT